MLSNEVISKSMENYNKNSDFQKVCNERCERLIEEHLITADSLKEFNILDLGCSHGKNSMIIVNKILDQLKENSTQVKLVNVVHEDLPENDFEQVIRCINDPTIGYLNHALSKTLEIKSHTVGKSFYDLVKPESVGPIDIAISLNTMHWLPSKPCPIYRGLLPNPRNLTPADYITFKKFAEDILVNFMELRYEEMKTGGLLIFNIHHKINVFEAEDEIWDEHLKAHNFTTENFKDFMMPVYCRTEAELQSSLDRVSDKFEVVHLKEGTDGGPTYVVDILRATHRPQFISGLKQYVNQFNGEAELVGFVDEFFDKMATWFAKSNPYVSNLWVVLKKK
ncbi:S-adenosyl-L-methionine-dependent methyltransferase [Conidiobolus coronatus NRRL 28638]|uniref:S-adenosyl-L-methionine-dependent methyltransferase n=1 Tax=Conidiobolus coronatus (strain ATCC 28846 / CBS 209.66 / NRRL 28638) TaxID=796925 RepID=A0A137NTW9_CONC2|nr:S-adenosyl-L-methionine-dependent methyltransferase [Conidiobolus coronatus NRRL 28638]|eukprot:KXN66200.1 S-adenosyl-L-methionine-dependent methyltransferase [Conidiobolus coronatus NRRL 28638]